MIPAALYNPIFLYGIIILTFFSLNGMGRKGFIQIKHANPNQFYPLILCLILAIWIGERPVAAIFGDTTNYAHSFALQAEGKHIGAHNVSDWIWDRFMFWCAQIMDVHTFFLIVETGYFGFTLWACKRFTPNNVMISLLFVFGALSFFSYGVNGIRNGLACSIVLVTLSYIRGSVKDKLIAAGLAFLAINIHRTTMLPIGMAVIAMYVVRNFKWAYIFWLLSIIISLFAGEIITSFFSGLGFDDRLSYLSEDQEESIFSHSGFRWDFLIYSMMPIILGYYIVIKRGIQNRTYLLLLNTYTLSNAFWVMVIRAQYSNRFAYLSWFMYPLVLAYPLLMLNIWGPSQGKKLKKIMLAQIGFTWFMQTFYWKG